MTDAIYARISSDPDDLQQGIERHVRLARNRARADGVRVPPDRVYRDNDVSASELPLAERPAGHHLLAAV